MTLNDFLLPLLGGAMIGLAAAVMMLTQGRIAGISGIWENTLSPGAHHGWSIAFSLGLPLGGLVASVFMPGALTAPALVGLPLVAVAGLLVGFGTRLGSGCTSGHGVCGISRVSARSLVATVTFIATGALTVLALRLTGVLA